MLEFKLGCYTGSTPPPLLAAADLPLPPAPPTILSCPIRNQQVRLDQIQIGSGSSDPKPTAQIKTYPLAWQIC